MTPSPRRSSASPPPSESFPSRRSARSSESGVVLICAIFILAILLSLVVSMASTAHVDLKASRNYMDTVQDSTILDGAIAHAEAILQADTDTGQDNLDDDWATLGSSGQDTIALGDGAYQVQILDAGSRVNLNTATSAQLLLLPALANNQTGADSQSIVDAIIDWRDTDDTPGSNGAESDTYQTYPRPYNAKNGPIDTVDELLMVQGMTPALLYGDPTQTPDDTTDPTMTTTTATGLADMVTPRSYEPNLNATGTARLNLSQVTAQQIEDITDVTITAPQAQAIVNKRSSGAYRSVADLLDVRIPPPNQQGQPNPGAGTPLPVETVKKLIDLFTVSSAKTLEGRINVNTASLDVLKTIPGMTEDAANNILSRRPFETVGDLLDDSVMPQTVFRQIVNSVCTKSGVFLIRVRAMARSGGMPQAMEALVERTADGMHLLRRREVARWPGWRTWNWPDPDFSNLTAPATAGTSTSASTTTTGTGSTTGSR